MRLNMGSGDHPAPAGWINVDNNPVRPNVDVLCDAGRLPYENHSVSHIYAGHVLEHIPILKCVDALQEWGRVLAPDGKLLIVGPDVQKAFHHGGFSARLYSEMLQGDPKNTDEHQWACTEAVVVQLVEAAGYTPVVHDPETLRGTEWPIVAYDRWQLAVEGVK